MLIFLLASIVGIIEGLYIDFYLCIALYFLLFIIAFIFKIDVKKVILIACCSLIFNIYTNFQINIYDGKYIKTDVEDDFKIISSKEEKDYYDKYIAENSNGDKFLLYLKKDKELKKGIVIHANGKFSLPDVNRNTGGFNYRRYLNSQKIYGSIYINDYYILELQKFNLIYYLQDEIKMSLAKLFPKNEMGLIMGMMIGDTKDISENILTDFKNTGITHLVAVSGSNVVYVVLLVELIFKKIVGKRATYFISIFFLIIFMLISGASSSVVRATIMMILTIIANILYLKSDVISNISFSALVLIIINPLIIFDVGFILSFGGTLGIVLLSKDLKVLFKKFGKLDETLAVTCSAQIVLTPIMMYFFNTISIISIITNIIVVPLSGAITILGFCTFIISKICFPLSDFISKGLYIFARFTISVSEVFSKISFSTLQTITPNFFEIVIFYFVIFALMQKINLDLFMPKKKFNFITYKPKRIPKKIIFIMVIIFIFIESLYYNLPRQYIDIRCVDVGQGDCVFIKTNSRKNILIDGGGSETYDVGENVLLPYLLDMRVTHVDVIISSHSDADHLNGLLTVLENISVGKVFVAKNSLGYEKLYEIANKKKVEVIEVIKGDVISVGDVIFDVVSPDLNMSNKDVNEYSLVVKLKYGNKSMLFTGDIGKTVESDLSNVTADILKVPHHGSSYSSSEKFIRTVKPDLSIIGVGKNNTHGHPNAEVVKRLQKISRVYTTAEYGEIKIKMYKNSIKVDTLFKH